MLGKVTSLSLGCRRGTRQLGKGATCRARGVGPIGHAWDKGYEFWGMFYQEEENASPGKTRPNSVIARKKKKAGGKNTPI